MRDRWDRLVLWVRRKPWASARIVLGTVVLLFGLSVVAATPRPDRNWVENLSVIPDIEVREDGFSLQPAMDWSYNKDGPAVKDMTGFAARFADLKNVWFVVEPQPGQPYAAHTLVLFEFAGDRMIGLTVEARLEKGETYSAIDGLFNRFELAYVWSTPKELLTRRVTYLGKQIYVYPLELKPEQKLNFLHNVLERTKDLKAHPGFYNTFTSNCTNELAKTAGIGWHYSWVLTGYSPQRLFELHLIPGFSFEKVQAEALMTTQVAGWNDLSSGEFNGELLAELRRRAAGP